MAMPSVMDPDRPVMNTVSAAAMEFSRRDQSISLTAEAIKRPTSTRAPAMHAEVITERSGVRNSARPNMRPTTTAMRPVLAPAAIPTFDSMKAVTVVVPDTAPTSEDAASTCIARSPPTMLPSSLIIPAWLPTATSVPVVSNTSTTSREIMEAAKAGIIPRPNPDSPVNMSPKSPKSGSVITSPTAAVPTPGMRLAPFTTVSQPSSWPPA